MGREPNVAEILKFIGSKPSWCSFLLSLYFELIYELVELIVELRIPILVGIHQDKQGFEGLEMRLFEFKNSLYSVKRRLVVQKLFWKRCFFQIEVSFDL